MIVGQYLGIQGLIMDTPHLTGFLLINKPIGPTSFDCIRRIRKVLGDKKLVVGHAGTLDPFAQGLMIVAVGRTATRELAHLANMSKVYQVTAKLGELRDTLDRTGSLLEVQAIPALSYEAIAESIKSLGSSYEQVPPVYSALKHQGKNLYELARNQSITRAELELIAHKKRRIVQLHCIELQSVNLPFFSFQADVSKGTYIRSLADDIAQRLCLRATTTELTRLSIGSFTLQSATSLDALTTPVSIMQALIPVESFIAQLPTLSTG